VAGADLIAELFADLGGLRQEHNGYSHQGPGFINNLLTKKGYIYRIYLPPDANTLLVTMEQCLKATNSINLIIAASRRCRND
jgi:xylulose-5-phosphate/fructose-6-phosphate phosphoketolase